MSKGFWVISTVLLLFLGIFIFWNYFLKNDVVDEPVVKEDVDATWSGEELSCVEFSCSNLESSNDRISVVYHPCLVKCSNGYKISESGQFAVIVPTGYELLAEKHLDDLQYCFPLLKEQLGLVPFYNKVYVVFPLADESKSYASTSTSSIYYYRTKDQLDSAQKSFKKRSDEGLNFGVGPDSCINAHEFTHIFTGELHLPRWANEGIAEYMITQMPDVKDKPSYCADDVLHFKSLKDEKFEPYSDLSKSFGVPDVDESNEDYLYETGACVFDYISEKYGQDKIKLIMQRFAEYAANHEPDEIIGKDMNRFSSKIFIREGIVPVIGEDAKVWLKKMFNL
ncbi:hypothetical protein A3I58_01575 [Candidatus Peregrinibacteria bacterium RIFCSPLOWO2_02_FULL_39_10]|nr:MAG: hypothetical protein A3I58_01575 [Candidatus Peregrinibacteria bacterium RIFCSPLOWO2_02_FULL_39_10]